MVERDIVRATEELIMRKGKENLGVYHSSFRVSEALSRGELLLFGREGHLAKAGHLKAAPLRRHGYAGDRGRAGGGVGPAETIAGG